MANKFVMNLRCYVVTGLGLTARKSLLLFINMVAPELLTYVLNKMHLDLDPKILLIAGCDHSTDHHKVWRVVTEAVHKLIERDLSK